VPESAFQTDVRPAIAEWRRARGLATDPLNAFREAIYNRVIAERAGRTQAVASMPERVCFC